MKYSLWDRERKEFKITEVFTEIQRWKRQKSEDRRPWNLAYYSASMNSNWLTDFISNPSFIIKNPSIVYSTFWDAYYVPGNFSTSDEMTILGYDGLNKYNAFFMVQALKQNKIKYSFWRKAFSNKILKDKILLPVDSYWKPDYKFMEDFIKEREKNKREKYRKYVENVVKTLDKNWDFRERDLK